MPGCSLIGTDAMLELGPFSNKDNTFDLVCNMPEIEVSTIMPIIFRAWYLM